jgi:hypothetical protein
MLARASTDAEAKVPEPFGLLLLSIGLTGLEPVRCFESDLCSLFARPIAATRRKYWPGPDSC